MEEIEKQLSQLDHLQSACTGCGLCLEGCITYHASGWEHESPRGRIQLAGQFLHGKIGLDSPLLKTFDRCLNCRACEPLCPQKVKYHQILQIVQEVRQQLHPILPTTSSWKQFIQKKLFKIKSLIEFNRFFFHSKQPILALCNQHPLFDQQMIEEALQLFKKLGIAVQISRFQSCSEKKIFPQTYFLSAGCQQKSGSPGFYQWIEKLIQERQWTLKLSHPQIIYYQPHCSTSLDEKEAIQRLLSKIEGLTVYPVSYAYACCGGNQGIQPQWIQTQLQALPHEMTLIVTSQECAAQWKQQIKNYKIKVVYLIQVINLFIVKN